MAQHSKFERSPHLCFMLYRCLLTVLITLSLAKMGCWGVHASSDSRVAPCSEWRLAVQPRQDGSWASLPPAPGWGGLAQSSGPGALGGLLRLSLPEQTMGRVRQAPGLAFGHIVALLDKLTEALADEGRRDYSSVSDTRLGTSCGQGWGSVCDHLGLRLGPVLFTARFPVVS